MRFRPCIDIHNGKVKQIVGGSLRDEGNSAKDNFASELGAEYYAELYRKDGLRGGHIILLNPPGSEYYNATKAQAMSALKAYPGGMQLGGGINAENAEEYLKAGASHVIVTSYVFKEGTFHRENLEKLVRAAGKEHVVLDLSCRKKEDALDKKCAAGKNRKKVSASFGKKKTPQQSFSNRRPLRATAGDFLRAASSFSAIGLESRNGRCVRTLRERKKPPSVSLHRPGLQSANA